MAVVSLSLAVSVDVKVTNKAGVQLNLPDAFGEWVGSEIRFCQSDACQTTYLANELEDPERCTECRSPLYSMSLGEAQLLPPDTGMRKQCYQNPGGKEVNVSIVLSGNERGSIHRPEVCLTGAGWDLESKEVAEVQLEGREPLQVMVLNLKRTASSESGMAYEMRNYYAYWFVGKDRETPYHLMRMYLMAADRVTRNVAHRWAYISVMGPRESNSDDYKEQIQKFVSDLYPHMSIGES